MKKHKHYAGVRTSQARRALLNYMRDHGLKIGDKLPPHDLLRRKTGFGTATITRALHSLKADGILAAKHRVGTFVANPKAEGYAGRVIGLAVNRFEARGSGPFASIIVEYLRAHFDKAGCETIAYARKLTPQLFVDAGIPHFPGLKHSIQEGRLDAVVLTAAISDRAWSWLKRMRMFPCAVGTFQRAPVGVFVDDLFMIRAGARELAAKGCRRPALSAYAGIPEVARWWTTFCETLANAKHVVPGRLETPSLNIEVGHRLAQDLLAKPEQERPDGILIPDDLTALGLCCGLARAALKGSAYRPKLVTRTSKQVPLDFPFEDVVRFEFDINELARMAVALTLRQLRGERIDNEVQWHQPQRLPDG